MFTHTVVFGKDKLIKKSRPLDPNALISILDHDPFNATDPDLMYRWHTVEVDDLLENEEMQEKYGSYVQRLNDFLNPKNESQVAEPHPLVERFNTKKAGIFRFDAGELKENHKYNERLAIQFYWGDVRIAVLNYQRGKLGEWVAYAWNPSRNEVYFFPRDFMPTELVMDMSTTPKGRGRPSDHLITNANCGPSALAAYLSISTEEAIKYLPIFKQKGWTNPEHIVKALNQIGKEYTHTEYQRSNGESLSGIIDNVEHGLAFIQYFYGKNEKISHTHWVAFDCYDGLDPVVYDVNVFNNPAYGKGNWVPLEKWENGVEAFVRENFRKQSGYKKFDGYFVRDVISLK